MTNSSSGGEVQHEGLRLDLSPLQCADLFPFHLIFDSSMRVLQVGASLAKVIAMPAGASVKDHFRLQRPDIGYDFGSIATQVHNMFLLKAHKGPLTLRGQMMRLGEDRMVFLGSPWAPEPGTLRTLGLLLQDFPLHDSMPELVNVVQSQRLAMDDLKQLTEKLRTQRHSLKEALAQLEIREKESRRLALIAARTDNCVIVTDAEGRVEWVNQSFEALTGYRLDEMRGRTPGSVLQGPATDPVTVEYMRKHLRAGEGFHCEVVNYSKSGRRYWLSVEVQPIRNELGTITNFMALESDITARKDYQARSRMAYSVTKVLAESTDAVEAVREILAVIGELLPCRFGALWQVDEKHGELSLQQYWADEKLSGSDFERQTVSRRFTKGTGLPGAVWQSNEPRWLPDLATEQNFPRSEAAIRSGLRSGFAFPIRLGGDVRGVMEFFSDVMEEPSPGMLETLVGLGGQLEQVLQRREAERQRGEVLALLDSTLESSTEGLMVTDREGRPLRVNSRWLELWAVPEPLAKSLDRVELYRWIDGQLQNPAARRMSRKYLLEHPEKTRADLVRLKDGRVIEVVTAPHRMGGEISGRVWTYRDVTEAHRSQQVRDELLATLNATLESTADGIYVADRNGKLITTNKRFTKLWGIPEDGAEYWRGRDLLPEIEAQLADPAAFRDRLEWFYAHPEESGFDFVHFPDGRVFEQSTQPKRVGERVTGRVWSYCDVTERWRADQALRESEERYRVVMQSASDAILTVDEKGIIVFGSRSAARLFGYPPEQLLGLLIWRLVPPEYRERETVRKLFLIGPKRSQSASEVEALCKDGSRIPIEISLHRSRVGGRKFVTGVLRDVTQRKLDERQLREAIEAADYANKAKSDFLANISHEMRTPLNSIIGLTELLRTTDLDAGEQEEILSSVWASSESLLHLINDLLDQSKIESGQLDIESVEFAPDALGEQVIEIVRLRAARKSLALFFIVDPASPPRLIGDANRIRQILVNLMSNAIKFTEQGSVTLRFGWSATKGTTMEARFVVEDTGIGISTEDQERVFDKFFRVNTQTGRRAGGAGLGLSISRLLCEAMGGTLSLTSAVGVGSRFALDLPLQTAGAPAAGVTAPLRTLLLTVKEGDARITPVLTSAGLAVEAFLDVPVAIAHADHSPPYDLFVLDERVAADREQLQLLLRLSMLGKELRWVQIRWSSHQEPAEKALPGRGESLESPFTPGRVERLVSQLFDRALEKPGGPTRIGEKTKDTSTAGASVLLVEDNPDSQAYALRVLAGAGYRTTVAATGAAAINMAQSARYDVILMDVMLPDMTGFEATRAIRSDEARLERSRVPVIALTAHALQDYRKEAFAADMDDYITKPVRPQSLLNAVKTWAVAKRPAAAECEEVTVDADLTDLIPGYLERVRSQLGQIREHAEAGRLAEVKRLGHNLKGTGNSYGFSMITQAGRQMEEAAQADRRDKVLELAANLSDWLDRVKWRPGSSERN